MSSHIVSPTCLNNIVAFCHDLEPTNYTSEQWSVGIPQTAFQHLKCPRVLHDRNDCQKFMDDLLRMNVAAVKYLYGERANDMLPKAPVIYNPNLDVRSVYQVLKSLHCYLYQCSEGKIPRRKLYKELSKFADDLAYTLATSTAAYEGAVWG